MAKAWLNGRVIDGPITLDPTDRGLTLGDGVFETLAVFNGRPAYLNPHLDRLAYGANALGIDVSRPLIENGISQLLSRPDKHAILRITVTRGANARGLAQSSPNPTALITLAPWQRGSLNAPVRLKTSSVRRNEHSPTSRLKTLSYADNILASREAAAAGADDALLLNAQGRAACSTISNIFIIRGAMLLTPPVSDGVLPGIIRSRVLALAPSAGLEPKEAAIYPHDLHPRPEATSDMIFLTNSIRLVRPVAVLDDCLVPQSAASRVGALLAALCKEIETETGVDPRALDHADL